MRRAFALAAALVVTGGCGYRVTAPNAALAGGLKAVAVPVFMNRTAEANVELTFINHESRSQLRKATLADQLPGRITWRWDGRADNGMLVAPGAYTVTVKAVDELGNEAIGQILTRIQY